MTSVDFYQNDNEVLAKIDHSVDISSSPLGSGASCYVLDLAQYTSALTSALPTFSLDTLAYVRTVRHGQVCSLKSQLSVAMLVFKYPPVIFKCHAMISKFMRLFCNNGILL